MKKDSYYKKVIVVVMVVAKNDCILLCQISKARGLFLKNKLSKKPVEVYKMWEPCLLFESS